MSNKYWNTDAAPETYTDSKPKDISKKGESYTATPAKVKSVKFEKYCDATGNGDDYAQG